MRRSARTLVLAAGALLASAAGTARAQPVTAAELESCRAAIERQRLEGDADELLSAADLCPEAAAAIGASEWGGALVEDDVAALAPETLAALAVLAAEYESSGAAGPRIRLDTLDAVLDAVHVPDETVELSLWERFTLWLREALGGSGGAASWLEDWLGNLSLSERILRIVLIAVGATLAAATLVIVVAELRNAGFWRRRPLPAGAEALDDAPRVLGFADVRRAPLARQPALLLALVLEQLRPRMPITASSTHRDLLGVAAALEPGEREPFGRVVTGAERATFGGWTPAPAEVESLLESGATLLERLADQAPDASPAPAAAHSESGA